MVELNLGLEIALFIAAGFLIGKLNFLPEKFDKGLSRLVINVLLPCLIVHSLNIEFDPEQLKKLAQTLLISVGTLAFLFIMGQVFFYFCSKDASGRVVRYGMLFSNFTFFGFPLVEALYGASGLFFFTVFTLPVRIIYYISPIFLFKPESDNGDNKTKPLSLRGIFTPPVIAIFVGLALYFGNVRLPDFLSHALNSAAGACSPLGLFLCGIVLSRLEVKRILHSPKILLLLFGRALIAPLCVILISLLLGIEPLLVKIAVMYASLPASSLMPTFALKYEGSYETAAIGSVGVFTTTVICIVTLPLWSMILERVLI